MPAFKADANTNVIVTLADVVTPDGVDHSADYTATYTTITGTAGIENITSNGNANGNVYGINGVLIKKNANASDIKNLRPGTYIINKKKVVR